MAEAKMAKMKAKAISAGIVSASVIEEKRNIEKKTRKYHRMAKRKRMAKYPESTINRRKAALNINNNGINIGENEMAAKKCRRRQRIESEMIKRRISEEKVSKTSERNGESQQWQ
jgi:hypothetical protein